MRDIEDLNQWSFTNGVIKKITREDKEPNHLTCEI